MPPKVKFTKEEIVEVAIKIAREMGIDGVTARAIAAELGVSTRPIFTWFATMDEVKVAVYERAKAIFKEYVARGLKGKVPFLGVGQAYIIFAREEPELYKLLFVREPMIEGEGAADSQQYTQELVRESLMKIYNMDADTADMYYRDLWFVAFSFGTMIVTKQCPYTDQEMGTILTQMSAAMLKGFKEIPGFAEGTFDRDKVFGELVRK